MSEDSRSSQESSELASERNTPLHQVVGLVQRLEDLVTGQAFFAAFSELDSGVTVPQPPQQELLDRGAARLGKRNPGLIRTANRDGAEKEATA